MNQRNTQEEEKLLSPKHEKKPSNGLENSIKEEEAKNQETHTQSEGKRRLGLLKQLKKETTDNKDAEDKEQNSFEKEREKKKKEKERIMERLLLAKKKKQELNEQYTKEGNKTEQPSNKTRERSMPHANRTETKLNQGALKLKNLFQKGIVQVETTKNDNVNSDDNEPKKGQNNNKDNNTTKEIENEDLIKEKNEKQIIKEKLFKLALAKKKKEKDRVEMQMSDFDKHNYTNDSNKEEMSAYIKRTRSHKEIEFFESEGEKEDTPKKPELMSILGRIKSRNAKQKDKDNEDKINSDNEFNERATIRKIKEINKEREEKQRLEEQKKQEEIKRLQELKEKKERDKKEELDKIKEQIKMQEALALQEEQKQRERELKEAEEEKRKKEEEEKEKLLREKFLREEAERRKKEEDKIKKEQEEKRLRELEQKKKEEEEEERNKMEEEKRQQEIERNKKEKEEKKRLEEQKRLKELERIKKEEEEKRQQELQRKTREKEEKRRLEEEKIKKEEEEEESEEEEKKKRELEDKKIKDDQFKLKLEERRSYECRYTKQIEKNSSIRQYSGLNTARHSERHNYSSFKQSETPKSLLNTSLNPQTYQKPTSSYQKPQIFQSQIIYNPKKGVRARSIEKNYNNSNHNDISPAQTYINTSPSISPSMYNENDYNIFQFNKKGISQLNLPVNRKLIYSSSTRQLNTPTKEQNYAPQSKQFRPYDYDSNKKTFIRSGGSLSINVEDLMILEEKLSEIITALNSNTVMSNECFEWWNYYFNCSLFRRIELAFKDDISRAIVIYSINIELLSIMICYDVSFDRNLLMNLFQMINPILNMNHENLMIICEYILSKISFESLNNIWVYKLRNLVISSKNQNNRNIMNGENDYFLFPNNYCIEIDKIQFNSTCIANDLKIIIKNYTNSQKAESLYQIYKNLNVITYEEINDFFQSKIMRVQNPNASVLASVVLRENWHFSTVEPPYLKSNNLKKYTLVLDLDETIVHLDVIPKNENEAVLKVRPGIYDFLNTLGNFYEIVVFTAATQEYADLLIDSIEENKIYFDYRLYRQHAVIIDNDFVKDLTRLGRPLDRIIIVDNMPQNFRLQKENGINIRTFWGNDVYDTALLELMPILVNIAKEGGDVRKGIAKYRDEILRKVTTNISKHNF